MLGSCLLGITPVRLRPRQVSEFPEVSRRVNRIYSCGKLGGAVASVGVQSAPAAQSKQSFLAQDSLLRSVVLSLLLAAVTVAVYAPVHRHPFADIDDGVYVTQNEHIKDGLTPGTAFWAFTHGYAGNWHPLTWMSHALDIQTLRLSIPAGHHDENVLLHA